MAELPKPIQNLTAALARLPGIGPRSAERIALFLVQSDPGLTQGLAEALLTAREKIQLCQTCGALTETQPCGICNAVRRDGAIVCVVETPVDVIRIEKSSGFHGHYHVLGGKISPVNGVEPDDLRIKELEARLKSGTLHEVIIALGTDVEGDATSYYLAKRLAETGVKVTRIAHGLPAGSGLEYADELTLVRALDGRRSMD